MFRHYNHAKKRCQEFIYGGCGANANNFRNATHCEEYCSSSLETPISEKPEFSDIVDGLRDRSGAAFDLDLESANAVGSIIIA